MTNEQTKAAYDATCERARFSSDRDGCTYHVNALIQVADGMPRIMGFLLGDFSDGATVATFYNGKKCEG